MNEHESGQGMAERAAQCRRDDPAFARWAEGYGVIHHGDETHVRVAESAAPLKAADRTGDAPNTRLLSGE